MESDENDSKSRFAARKKAIEENLRIFSLKNSSKMQLKQQTAEQVATQDHGQKPDAASVYVPIVPCTPGEIPPAPDISQLTTFHSRHAQKSLDQRVKNEVQEMKNPHSRRQTRSQGQSEEVVKVMEELKKRLQLIRTTEE